MNRLWNLWRVEPPPGPPMWVPILGQLQRTLRQGDYPPLRPLPMFESDFVQVTSRGAPVYVHHSSNHLTMGVAASLPSAPLPDLLLIARPSEDRDCPHLLLSRMIPLALVRLYVHNQPARCLKLCLLTGRYYYLELNAPDREKAFLFRRWVRLISLLREAPAPGAPGALSTPPSELAQATPPASTWQLQDQPHSRRSATAAGPRKMLAAPKQKAQARRPGPDRGALRPEPSAAAPPSRGPFRSRAVGDSVPLVWSQLEALGSGKRGGEKK
uniref:Golgi associated RAB2 interactor protein-like Rab2B-binding domain-containing protein n=2 Tax=Pipistrellus kuhlii TaxID=59472 RepID=A0A7J7QV24_PIPKU|nr:hypothetical protein mPipKuh1_008348 [Pipistrellus kuhlii]